jgi:hypothetical protein
MCLVLDWITLDLEVNIELIGSFADCSEAAKGTRKAFSPSLLRRGEGRF